MGMNLLSWAAIILLILYAFNGMRRGLIRTVFSTVTIVVAIILASNLSPQVSRAFQETAWFDTLNGQVEASLMGTSDMPDEPGVAEQTEIIQQLPLPESIKSSLLENNNTQIYDALGISAFKSYVANYITCLIVNALAYLLVFIAAVIILKILAACLDIISHLPVLHTMNRLGGFLLGLLNGFVILWIICIAASIFSSTELGSYVYGQINESPFLLFVYEHNYLMNIVMSLKYLLV